MSAGALRVSDDRSVSLSESLTIWSQITVFTINNLQLAKGLVVRIRSYKIYEPCGGRIRTRSTCIAISKELVCLGKCRKIPSKWL